MGSERRKGMNDHPLPLFDVSCILVMSRDVRDGYEDLLRIRMEPQHHTDIRRRITHSSSPFPILNKGISGDEA